MPLFIRIRTFDYVRGSDRTEDFWVNTNQISVIRSIEEGSMNYLAPIGGYTEKEGVVPEHTLVALAGESTSYRTLEPFDALLARIKLADDPALNNNGPRYA
jgi:hypothetical protein